MRLEPPPPLAQRARIVRADVRYRVDHQPALGAFCERLDHEGERREEAPGEDWTMGLGQYMRHVLSWACRCGLLCKAGERQRRDTGLRASARATYPFSNEVDFTHVLLKSCASCRGQPETLGCIRGRKWSSTHLLLGS